MGEVAVIQPQDCRLKKKFTSRNMAVSGTKSLRNSKPDVSKPPINRRRKSSSMVDQSSKPKLVMGQVKILKRGEELTEIVPEATNRRTPGVQVSNSDFMLPQPDDALAKKFLFADLFAGSVVTGSPSPTSLPVPNFFSKRNDPATEIRRLLQI